ncbi:MAG: hypothetical protein ABI672_14355 [Vicinamibacteria bacterium]
MRYAVVTTLLLTMVPLAGAESVRISPKPSIGGCHDIVIKGPEDAVAAYRDTQTRKSEKVDERVVKELSRWVWVNVVLKSNVDSCGRPTGVPKSVVLFEKGKEDTAVVTADLTATPVKLTSGIAVEFKAFNAIGKLSIDDMRAIIDRELVIYLVYVNEPREGAAWKRDYATKILKAPGK